MRFDRFRVLGPLLFALAATASAQSWQGPAALGVEVNDQRGRDLSGARVEIRYRDGDGGPGALLTDGKGRAAFVGLAPGAWSVEVSHPGHLSYVAAVLLQAGKKPEVTASFLQATGTGRDPLRVKLFKARGTAGTPAPPPAETPAAAPAPPEDPAPAPPTPPAPEPEPEATPAAAAPAEPAPVETAAPPVAVPTAAEEIPPPQPGTETAPEPDASPDPAPSPPAPPRVVDTAPAPPPLPAAEPEPTPTPEAPAEPEATPRPEAAAQPDVVPTPVEPATPPAPPAPQPEPEPRPAPAAEPEAPPAPPTPPAPAPQPRPETPPAEEPESPAAPPAPVVEAEPRPEPPRPEPAPTAPAAEPTPAPPATADAPTAAPVEPPAPTPQAPATETVPAIPTAPTPAPEPPAPTATPAPPLRSFAQRSCAECKPGEWAATARLVLPPGPGCPEGLDLDARPALERLASAGAAGLDRFAGQAAGPIRPSAVALLPAEERAELAALWAGLGTESCRPAAVALPAGARFVGFRFEAGERAGRGDSADCQAGEECPAGSAYWSFNPKIVRGSDLTVIYSVFENRSTEAPKTGRLVVYFVPPSSSWRPAP